MVGEERPEPPTSGRALSKACCSEEPAARIHPPARVLRERHRAATRAREAIAPERPQRDHRRRRAARYSHAAALHRQPRAPPARRARRRCRTSTTCARSPTRAAAGGAAPGRRLVVIGGGFIGLEVASSALKRGLAVTVVERQPRCSTARCPPTSRRASSALHRAPASTSGWACGARIHVGNGA